MAVSHDVERTIRRSLVDTIAACLLERRARALGIESNAQSSRSASDKRLFSSLRTGAIAVAQRFGSGLNLHVQLHVLATDGTFVGEPDALSFRDVGLFLAEDVCDVRARVVDGLVAIGFFDALVELDTACDADEIGPHDDVRLASVRHRIALGPRRGERVERVGKRLARELESRTLELVPGRFKARYGGFDLEACTRVAKDDRRALERLCRYVFRLALGEDRLTFEPEGRITLALKSPWPDGTTHPRFMPLELVEKLAALVPRPHQNLLVFQSVFAADAKGRPDYVAFGRRATPDGQAASPPRSPSSERRSSPAPAPRVGDADEARPWRRRPRVPRVRRTHARRRRRRPRRGRASHRGASRPHARRVPPPTDASARDGPRRSRLVERTVV